MDRKPMDYTACYDKVMEVMTGQGLLLAGYDPAGKANAMAIGWGAIGTVWGKPMWIVLVRHSRHTFDCIEHTGAFTVNVPTPAMAAACELCGTKSGRDGDKLAEAGLKVVKSRLVEAPIMADCPIVYECQVVHSNDVLPERMAEQVSKNYPRGDYHRVYFGRILAASAADGAAGLLG